MPEFIYRAAAGGDVAAIRDLQVESWRHAYRGMLSEDFLSGGVERVLAQHWAAMPGDDWIVETAWAQAGLAGFVAADCGGHGEDGAFVDNLHVAPRFQGRGLGRVLMARTAVRMTARGLSGAWLTVIRENRGSRDFYRRLGGVEGPEIAAELFGEPIVKLAVRWHDLRPLEQGLPRGEIP
ncbi:MAG: GNAT family N-acetyltransferase [Rhodobacteraceae bacterium]|nr:GNAT family N-acetyltransferase [Paracoccaceae bacterium]